MALSVKNQVNTSIYFSISTIDKEMLKKYGIGMTVTEFKKQVRGSPPYTVILTGEAEPNGHRKATKIYRYQDFIGLTT